MLARGKSIAYKTRYSYLIPIYIIMILNESPLRGNSVYGQYCEKGSTTQELKCHGTLVGGLIFNEQTPS